MMRPATGGTLAGRLTAHLVLTVALAAFLASAGGLLLMGRAVRRAWERDASERVHDLAARLADPMWRRATDEIAATCGGFVVANFAAYVRVTGDGGRTLFVSGEPDGGLVELSAPIQHAGRTLGRAEIGLARHGWLTELVGSAELNVVTVAAVLGALAGWGYFVRRRLRRPLDRLVALLDQLSLGHYPDAGSRLEYREFSPILGSFWRMADRVRAGEASLRQSNERLREAEHAARESAATLQTVFDTAPIGVALVADRTLLRVNERFCAITGYAQEELVNGGIRRMYADDAEYERIGEQLYAAGPTGALETAWRRKDGTAIDVRLQASAVDASTGASRLTLTVTDVTEERRAAAEHEALRERVARSQKLEAIGTLAGGIAHDFNNILGAIIGYTEFCLKSETLAPELRDDLQVVRQAGRRAADLVRQILAFSRQASQERVPFQPRVVAAEALKLLRASLPATIHIRTRLECQAEVIADPAQIHQIVVNLCTNAALAMRDRGGRLDVELSETGFDEAEAALEGVEPQRFVRLTVRDTGCGMSREVQARMFEPFFTTRRDGEGTGMGLAVVHGIVKASGGYITVRSAPGLGSTFDVYLPMAPEASSGETAQASQGLGGGSERVLFVDDEPLLTDLAQRALARGGYAVQAFTSSEEALRAFEAAPHAWDAIVTDMTMPNLTGSELIRRARALRPDVPVLLCTGYSEQMTSEQAAALGIDRFAFKPVTPAELRRLLRDAIDARKGTVPTLRAG